MIWRQYVKVFISCLGLIAPLPFGRSECNMGGLTSHNYSFVHLDNLNWQSEYAPYLMLYGVLAAPLFDEETDRSRDDNIAEWRSRFCSYADSADVEAVVYKTPIETLAELRDATATHPRKDVYYALMNNTFARTIKWNGCTDVVDYLMYAKQCERYCVKGDLWQEQPRDVAQMFYLINQGRDQFKHTDSHFLKLRYAYQMVRLAHYAKDYKAVLQIYDDVIPKIKRINSIINYWILAHKAGALKALGKRAEAAYIFAVVFRYAPSKRRQAFESFDVATEAEWQACLKLCNDDKERAALYAIRASYDKAKALDDMTTLYRLDPQNEHLTLLLMRETLRLEKILLGYSFRRQRYPDAVIKQNIAYAQKLWAFVSGVADQKFVKNPAFWRVTEGYLNLLIGDWRLSLKTLNEARLMTKDANLLSQIDAFDLAARITGLQGVDAGMDTLIDSLRHTDAYLSDLDFDDYFKEKVGSIYRNHGQIGVSYLTDYTLKDLERNPSIRVLEDLIALCQKKDKSKIELELTTLRGTKTIESILWDLKGRAHLARFELEAALEAFKNVPELERGKKYTPFLDKNKDCINCITTDTAMYDRLGFTQRMLDIEFNLRAGVGDAATLHYLAGLGYYNMTYFGNSSTLADAMRSGSTWYYLTQKGSVFPLPNHPLGNYEVTDVSLALAHFEKARQLSLDPNVQARCAFWCAKCELAIFYQSKDFEKPIDKKTAPTVPPQYRRYFKLLKESYSKTAFYKEAETECSLFKFYTSK